MAWYNTGTVTATLNSATITGVSTAFLTNVRIGDGVTIAGSTSLHEVTNIASETQLTISPVYPGTTGAGKAYSIVPVQGYTKTLADQAKALLLTYSTIAGSASINALAGTTGTANMIPYFTSGSAMSTTPLTAAGRALIDDADSTAMRATLGLKDAAVRAGVGLVGSGDLMEAGSNAAGYYYKFLSGLMICTGAFVGYGVGVGTYGLPSSFSASPAIFVSVVPVSGYDFSINTWGGPTSFSFYSANARPQNAIYWAAVGRWN